MSIAFTILFLIWASKNINFCEKKADIAQNEIIAYNTNEHNLDSNEQFTDLNKLPHQDFEDLSVLLKNNKTLQEQILNELNNSPNNEIFLRDLIKKLKFANSRLEEILSRRTHENDEYGKAELHRIAAQQREIEKIIVKKR